MPINTHLSQMHIGLPLLQNNSIGKLKFTVKRIFFQIKIVDKTPVLHTFWEHLHLGFCFFFFTFALRQQKIL